jgi:hypothetical protein
MRRAWYLPGVVVIALVCLCASSGLAGGEYVFALEFDGLDFRHLIAMFQKARPDLVFVAAPGVADLSLTIKAPPLPLDDAMQAAAGALDIEVYRAGKVVVFRPRLGQVPEKRPRPEARARSGPLPVRPWPESFIGSDMLVDLVVKDKPLTEVAKLLEDCASAYDFSRGAAQPPTTRPFQVVIAGLDPLIPSRVRIAASFHRRPLAEVLGFLTDQLGLTYAVDQGADKTVIFVTPRPWLADPARAETADRHELEDRPRSSPRSSSETPQ